MEWIATCPHETIDTLEQELNDLGVRIIKKLFRGIIYECDLETAYRAHLLLRTASRIQLVVAKFPVKNQNDLERELATIDWARWIRHHRPYTVFPTLTDESLENLDADQIIRSVEYSVKKGSFEKGPPDYKPNAKNPIGLVLFFRDGNCVVGIDTAGKALHKRGWRVNGHPAVLKETLAASLLMKAGYTGNEVIFDPMCGSGTLIIEAAYIALEKATLIHRSKDDFALEHIAGFDRQLWRKVCDNLRQARREGPEFKIYASDINEKFVNVARSASLKARVEKHITFGVSSFQKTTPPADTGLLIMNLPYGERIGKGMIDNLYKEVGKTIKEKYSNWKVALLVPTRAPIHLLDFTPSKKHFMKNGALDVWLLVKNDT